MWTTWSSQIGKQSLFTNSSDEFMPSVVFFKQYRCRVSCTLYHFRNKTCKIVWSSLWNLWFLTCVHVLCSAAVHGRCWSLPVSVHVSRAIWRSCVFQCLDCYTVSLTATGLCWEFFWTQRKRDCQRSMPVWLWVRMREAIAQARDLLFTTQRNRVKSVKYICMKLPYVAQQVWNPYFYRLTEIKELSGSLWWMHEGRNLLKPVAGCRLFCAVELTGVARH